MLELFAFCLQMLTSTAIGSPLFTLNMVCHPACASVAHRNMCIGWKKVIRSAHPAIIFWLLSKLRVQILCPQYLPNFSFYGYHIACVLVLLFKRLPLLFAASVSLNPRTALDVANSALISRITESRRSKVKNKLRAPSERLYPFQTMPL